MPVSSVSANTANANAVVSQNNNQNATAPQTNNRPKLSTKGKIILTGLAILGVYGVASLVKSRSIISENKKLCESLENGIDEIIGKAKEEISGFFNTKATIESKLSPEDLNVDAIDFILKDQNLTKFDPNQAIEEGSSIIHVEKGKIKSILNGYKKGKENIDVYSNAVFFENDNKVKLAYGCNCKNRNSLISANKLFFFKDNEPEKLTIGFMQKPDGIKSLYNYVINLGDENKITQIEMGSEVSKSNTSCQYIFRKKDNGKWKRV